MPKFMKVATTDELEDEQAKLVEVEGQKIALFRLGEAFYALSDTCTHRGGPLSEGRGCPGGAGGTRGQELPGAGHWRRRRRDRSVKQRVIPVCIASTSPSARWSRRRRGRRRIQRSRSSGSASWPSP